VQHDRSHARPPGPPVSALTEQQIESATQLLIAAREKRLALAGLPSEVTPDNLADVQRVINAVSARIDTPVRGWKTYCLYKPMQPVFYAPIYNVLASGAEIAADVSPGRLIEPEIMFRIDRDLPPRDRQYDVLEILEAVTAVIGFEVIGSRFSPQRQAPVSPPLPGQGSLYGSFCDHISNGAIVVGDTIPGWRDVAFEDVALRMTEDDRELVSVVGCHPIDNPVLPVVAGVNRLRRHRGIKAGAIMITSSSTSFLPVAAGAEIRAGYEGLDEVRARFRPT
jgi:2-keto-4-pentenoate hydratase